MGTLLIVALSLINATGTAADDYYRRSFHESQPDKRLAILSRAIDVNPNHVPSLRARSALYLLLEKKKEALADAARAADLAPDDPDTNFAAGAIAEDLSDFARAATFYARTVADDENNPLFRGRLIEALIKLRRIDEALKDAEFLMSRFPQQDFPYLIRAEVYEWFDKYADAIKDLDVVIDRHPDDVNYAQNYLRRCINLRCLGEGRRALADAEKAMLLKGSNPYVHAARGCSYEILGDLDKAFDDFQKAAQQDDDKRYFTIWSVLILRKQGKRPDADKLAKDFLKDLKEDKWIAPVLKYLAGDMKEEDVFRLAQDPDAEKQRQQLCEAYYYIGACYLAERQLDKAEALFKKCLEQRVNNFYEHGFAIRDLRVIQSLREKKPAPGGTADGETRPR